MHAHTHTHTTDSRLPSVVCTRYCIANEAGWLYSLFKGSVPNSIFGSFVGTCRLVSQTHLHQNDFKVF